MPIVLLLLLVVGVFVYVGYNTNSIVKNAIETIGTQYLGAPVKVKEVEIALQEGRGTLKELEIGNPPGYTGAYAMRFGTVSVEMDAAHSTAQLIVLKRVTIDGARAAAIANTPKDTNFRALSSNVPTSSGSSTVKLIVDKLDLTNTQASVSSPLLTRALEVNVPDEHLTDIGRSTNGVDVGTRDRAGIGADHEGGDAFDDRSRHEESRRRSESIRVRCSAADARYARRVSAIPRTDPES